MFAELISLVVLNLGDDSPWLKPRGLTARFDKKAPAIMRRYHLMQYLAPEYICTPAGLQSNMLVAISDDGRIASITQRSSASLDQARTSLDTSNIELLPGIALLPGFVNVHSHVFQRFLRGHTHRPLSAKDTFWTWRN